MLPCRRPGGGPRHRHDHRPAAHRFAAKLQFEMDRLVALEFLDFAGRAGQVIHQHAEELRAHNPYVPFTKLTVEPIEIVALIPAAQQALPAVRPLSARSALDVHFGLSRATSLKTPGTHPRTRKCCLRRAPTPAAASDSFAAPCRSSLKETKDVVPRAASGRQSFFPIVKSAEVLGSSALAR